MKITIDKAGRVVIPASLREQLRLEAGTELEITLDDVSLRLTRVAPGPRLSREGGRLVVRPSVDQDVSSTLDAAVLVDEERDRWPL